jgi:hypothetical protein
MQELTSSRRGELLWTLCGLVLVNSKKRNVCSSFLEEIERGIMSVWSAKGTPRSYLVFQNSWCWKTCFKNTGSINTYI